MINFDSNKCSFNNLDDYFSIKTIASYLNSNKLGSGFTIVNNACKCDNTEFELFKFYFAVNDEIKNISNFYTDESDLIEEWSTPDNFYNFIEALVYYCSDCGYWCVDYNDI